MRKLLATTALVALFTSPVLADTKQIAAKDGAHDTSLTTIYLFEVDTLGTADARGYLASNLLGKTVYASDAEDAESVGEVDDLLVGEDGAIRAAIVGVGGFLGMGEKEVAIDFERLSMQATGDSEVRVVSTVTKEELENAPAYQRPEYIPGWSMDSSEHDQMAEKTAMADEKAFASDKTMVEPGRLSAEEVIGARVYDAAWNDVGEVSDVLLTADGKIDAAIVDIGGWLGLGEKPVALGFDSVDIYADDGGDLHVATPYSKEELDAAQAYDAETYDANSGAMRLTPRS